MIKVIYYKSLHIKVHFLWHQIENLSLNYEIEGSCFMESKRIVILIFSMAVLVLAACGNSTDKTNGKTNSQSPNTSTTQHANNDTSNKDKTSDDSSSNQDDNADSNMFSGEVTLEDSIEMDESKKGIYLKKLSDTKNKTEKLEATDSSTYALKKVEDDRWDTWDDLLNEIYGVLKEQLSAEEMEQLQKEQRDWIKYRDDTALKASQKFKGSTQEHLEYSAVAANVTEERCYQLVEKYM